MAIDSKDPGKVGAGHGKGGMLLQIEPVYNDVKDRFGPTHFMGAYNNRNVRGGKSKSMHAYGRAFDIGGSKEVMYKISRYLQKVPGIQYVIYNHEISSNNGPFRPYRPGPGGSPHEDHVHADFPKNFRYKGGLAGAPTVKEGSAGGWIETLQSFFSGLKMDGIFGAETEKAVKKFQEQRNLEPDGIVGKKTWEKLSSEKGIFFYK
jgi:peptidoglycan hydrolase-like protein with peptidoglycan-binding domain